MPPNLLAIALWELDEVALGTRRNPKVLKTYRKYLHWTQRSFRRAFCCQYSALMTALERIIDPRYDSIITCTARSPTLR